MSTTADSALPPTLADEEAGDTRTLTQRASETATRLVDLARDNPRTAIAAGAAVAAGVAAAAAIPMVRAARRKGANGAAAPKAAPATAAARKRAPARKRPAKKG
jgi:hypothetical protein